MKKEYVIIGSIFAFFLLLYSILSPFLNVRDATRVVTTVLTHWQNRDILRAIDQWEDREKYPPVYNLASYKIKNKKYKKIKGEKLALIFVDLYFSAGNLLPSGKEWLFTLRETKLGWKVVNFHQVGKQKFEYGPKTSSLDPMLDDPSAPTYRTIPATPSEDF